MLKYSRIALFIILSLLLSTSELFSQSKSYPLNLSLWYPISINQSDEDIAYINLPILYGRIGTVKGINLGLGVSSCKNDIHGLQINGLMSWVGGRFSGLSLTGGVNAHGNTVKGVEAAALANFVEGDIYGLQFVGAYNFVLGDLYGAQWSALINVTGGNAGYFQFGNANMVGETFTGLQVATIFNYIGDKVYGVQNAAVNIAGELHGLQLGGGNVVGDSKGVQAGIVNIAKVQEGVQIGVVNIAGKQVGVPIGIINIAGNGDYNWITYLSNFSTFNTGIKMSANNFFSMVDIGGRHIDSDNKESGTLGCHWGYNFVLNNIITLSPDLGYVQIVEEKEDLEPGNEHKIQFALQGRLIGEYSLTKFLKIIAGIGYSYHYDIYEYDTFEKGKFIFLGGISLF